MIDNDFFSNFRAQLALPEQRHFFDYWVSQIKDREMPDRKDINPADIPRHLPFVCLLEIEQSPLNFKFKLAGTQLREVYDREVTNSYLSAMHENNNRDYWISACERIAHTGRPAQGVLRGPAQSRDHLVQFWLRLPLAINGDGPKMILGLDKCIPVSDVSETEQIIENIAVR